MAIMWDGDEVVIREPGVTLVFTRAEFAKAQYRGKMRSRAQRFERDQTARRDLTETQQANRLRWIEKGW